MNSRSGCVRVSKRRALSSLCFSARILQIRPTMSSPTPVSSFWLGLSRHSRSALSGFFMQHELQHINTAKEYFNRNKSHFVAMERTFGSQAECLSYLNDRLNVDMENMLKADWR